MKKYIPAILMMAIVIITNLLIQSCAEDRTGTIPPPPLDLSSNPAPQIYQSQPPPEKLDTLDVPYNLLAEAYDVQSSKMPTTDMFSVQNGEVTLDNAKEILSHLRITPIIPSQDVVVLDANKEEDGKITDIRFTDANAKQPIINDPKNCDPTEFRIIRCGKKYYRVRFPKGCNFYSSSDGWEVICDNGCNSYGIRCTSTNR